MVETNRDRIEFYLGDACVSRIESSHAPDRGDKVNIRKTTYVVVGRSYTVDHADEFWQRSLCCVVTLGPVEGAVEMVGS